VGEPPDAAAVVASAAPASAALPVAPPTAGPALAVLRDRLAEEAESAADAVDEYDLQRALLIALEAILRGGPFHRSCFCAPDARVTELRARFGLGDAVDALVAQLRVPLAPARSPVGSALLRGDEVFLQLGVRASAAEAAMLRGWGAASAGLLPVVADGSTIGCLYFDRAERLGVSAAVDAPTLAYVRRIAAAVARGVARRRATPRATPPRAHDAVTAPWGHRAVAGPAASPPLSDAQAAAPAGGVAAPEGAAAALRTVERRAAAVLRLLRGEPAARLSAELGVPVADLERWRGEFLAGAIARLAASG
jgi:hypothetical protein